MPSRVLDELRFRTATRRLAATVRSYPDENGSRGRTAIRLSIHENTVTYRFRQS